MRLIFRVLVVGVASFALLSMNNRALGQTPASHPRLRPEPEAVQRPFASGPGFFVDAARGRDEDAGTEKAPWRSINQALTRLSPGDTLYLRGGTYFENVTCSIAGEIDKPITIRSYPGEQAVIDASLREFQDSPATSWEPVPDGAEGEYRTVRSFKNIRDVVGLFGDSLVGLQTYWYVEDLRAKSELWENVKGAQFDPAAVYCGPGIWYEKVSGKIHARLAHTNIPNPEVANYRGETDPRKLPLVISPYGAVVLDIDQAMHVRFQDLVLRGAGYNAVLMKQAVNLDFDNVTIYAGTYGVRAQGTGPLKFSNSAIYGMIPPWAFRDENSLRLATPTQYAPFMVEPGKHPRRNIARLNTHAVLVTEGFDEFDVFAYPLNHDWDISNSEFTDGHDGIYLSGHNIRFHHNYVNGFQDDAIYLSAPSPNVSTNIHVYQNLISRVGMSFGMHTRGGPRGEVYVYRNICDQRKGTNFERPTKEDPVGKVKANLPLVIHGREFLGSESVYFYHNLFISPNVPGFLSFGLHIRNSTITSRWLMNNLYIYLPAGGKAYPFRAWEDAQRIGDVQMDGNIHWCPDPSLKPVDKFLELCQKANRGEFTKSYPHPWETNSQVADPLFTAFSADPKSANDYHLQAKSPAIGKGVKLPESLPDVLQAEGTGPPDIGPLPANSGDLRVGRQGRYSASQPQGYE